MNELYETERRDFYRKTFNTEPPCDIASRRDAEIARLRAALEELAALMVRLLAIAEGVSLNVLPVPGTYRLNQVFITDEALAETRASIAAAKEETP